jgi:hypothetical protein
MGALATLLPDIVSRAMDDRPEGLSTEAAEYFLSLHLSAADIEKMNELAAKARADSLSSDEQDELEEYIRCTRFLDILKLKSRLALQGK